jgi:hypothetical protein
VDGPARYELSGFSVSTSDDRCIRHTLDENLEKGGTREKRANQSEKYGGASSNAADVGEQE